MISDAYKTILVSIPRTGGHTIVNLFELTGGGNSQIPVGRHATPSHYIKYVLEKWNSYYKFTIVRNPFDRIVSIFSHAHRNILKDVDIEDNLKDVQKMFSDWVVKITIKTKNKHLQSATNWLLDEKGNTYDFNKIVRYENLNDELKTVMKDVGMANKEIPVLSKTNRSIEYQKYYNKEARKKIYQMYRDDFDLLGYSFK